MNDDFIPVVIQTLRVMLFNDNRRFTDFLVAYMHSNSGHPQYPTAEKLFNDFFEFMESNPTEEELIFLEEHLQKVWNDQEWAP